MICILNNHPQSNGYELRNVPSLLRSLSLSVISFRYADGGTTTLISKSKGEWAPTLLGINAEEVYRFHFSV
jgi:hypothetical protein